MTAAKGFGRWWLLLHAIGWSFVGLFALGIALYLSWRIVVGPGADTPPAGALLMVGFGGGVFWLARHGFGAARENLRSITILGRAILLLLVVDGMLLLLTLLRISPGARVAERAPIFDQVEIGMLVLVALDGLLILRILKSSKRAMQ